MLHRMNMHRVGERPDWELVSKKQQNRWQRLAARTGGIITPANVTSIVGAIFVGIGLWRVYCDDLTLGLVLIAIGRIADILDGAVAQLTGTKSSVGEALDASIDKLTVIAALGVLIATGTIPAIAATLMALRNTANITLSLLAKAHNKVLHPSLAGKLAGGLEWVSILCFVLAAFFVNHGGEIFEFISLALAYIVLVITLALGLIAIRGYSVRTLDLPRKDA